MNEIIYIVTFTAITFTVAFIHQLGEKKGHREGFLEGWYFRHEKDGYVTDDLMEEILPRICTTNFGNLVDPSAFGSKEKQAFLKWMVNENPRIGRGLTFKEFAEKHKADFEWLLEEIEKRKKQGCFH